MRTAVYIFDPFHRDISWITQEVIEEFVASRIRGMDAANRCILKWCKADINKADLMREMMNDAEPDLKLLEAELIDEFGEQHFIGPPLSKARRRYILEQTLQRETDSKKVTEISKEIRELNGETVKPADKMPDAATVGISIDKAIINFDRNNPRECERVVMSVLGSL